MILKNKKYIFMKELNTKEFELFKTIGVVTGVTSGIVTILGMFFNKTFDNLLKKIYG